MRSFDCRVILWLLWNKLLKRKHPGSKQISVLVQGKSGLEIGGPSSLFEDAGFLPLYSSVGSLDGVNFSSQTLWESKLPDGNPFRFGNRTGVQFIAEGTVLDRIPDATYQFVLSCNNLEHIANPVKALYEWKRVLGSGGVLLIVVPNKTGNFDHKRPYTTFDHLLQDYTQDIGEDDMTHLQEILQLHDLKRDPYAGKREMFESRCLRNAVYRAMHHHVFNAGLLAQLMEFVGMKVVHQYETPKDFYIVATKIVTDV